MFNYVNSMVWFIYHMSDDIQLHKLSFRYSVLQNCINFGISKLNEMIVSHVFERRLA